MLRTCQRGHQYTPGRGCTECERERKRRRYLETRDVWLQRNKDWQANNKERANTIKRNWEKRNQGYRLQKTSQRRRDIAKTKLTKDERKAVNKLYAMSKALREAGFNFDVDHRIPLAAGGEHGPWNLQILPRSDNCRKGDNIIPSEVTAVLAARVRWAGCNSF